MLSFGDIIAVGLGSGIVATALTIFVDLVRENARERRQAFRDARYLALRLAPILEEFVIACADRIGENDLHYSSGGNAGKVSITMPELTPYPTNADWKAFDASLASRAFTFRTEVSLASKWAPALLDVAGDPDGAADTLNKSAAYCGKRSIGLASDIRAKYQLQLRDKTANLWDFESVLENHLT